VAGAVRATLASLALVGAMTSASLSRSEIIKCTYTEPFITTIYNSDTHEVTISNNALKTVTKLANVSRRTIKPKVFELRNAKKTIVQTMELNHRGSDGMTDTVYPYDSQWNKLHGGCTSSRLR
jgi:hypothetical protein